jgi:aspartate carbamoyltransferase catalytic subunit
MVLILFFEILVVFGFLYKKNTIYLLSPKELKLTKEDFSKFSKEGIKLIEIESEKDIPENAHFWYWTRVQKERFKSIKEYEKVKNRFRIYRKAKAGSGTNLG